MFNTLAKDDGLTACAVHKMSSLRVTQNTVLAVGTLVELLMYSEEMWQDVHTVVYDEIDRVVCVQKNDFSRLHKCLQKVVRKRPVSREAKSTGEETIVSPDEEGVPLPPVTSGNRQFIALSATIGDLSGKSMNVTPYFADCRRPCREIFRKSAYQLPQSANCQFKFFKDESDKNSLLLKTLQGLAPTGKTVFPRKESPRVIVFAAPRNIEEVKRVLASVKPPPPSALMGSSKKKAMAEQVYASCWWHQAVATWVAARGGDDIHQGLSDFISGKCNLLLSIGTTEARGLDLCASAVVLYDFPSSRDFIHQAGRTARGGAEGLGKCSDP